MNWIVKAKMQTTWLNRALCLLALALALTLAHNGVAGDWPQYLGPNGDGTSSEKGLARAFPSSGPKVLWTVQLGKGYGGAAVRDGQVFVLDREGREGDILRCLDLESGKESWTFRYAAPGTASHDGSRSTPTVTEQRIFTIGLFGHLHAIDRSTHKAIWKKHLLEDFGGRLPKWAVSQSPLAYKDLLVVAPQTDAVGLVALDQATGKERWRSGPVGTMAYASPKLVTLAGTDQIVLVTKEGARGVDAGTGQNLWAYEHPCRIPVPNVSALGNNQLFVTGGYDAGSAIIEVSRQGDSWQVTEKAKISRIGGHCHPALVRQDHLYVLCNTNERKDGMVCFDFQGRMKWQTERDPYLCKGGSILTADGIMYAVDGTSGELHIAEPSPAGFKSLAKATLLEGREIWAPLALSNGRLLIRDQGQMKCVDLRAN